MNEWPQHAADEGAMFEEAHSFDRGDRRAIGSEPIPPIRSEIGRTCEACGQTNQLAHAYCVGCGSRAAGALAPAAKAQLEILSRASIDREHTDREWSRMVDELDLAIAAAAHDAVPRTTEPTHPTSAAELVWDGLERDDVTAVWSSTTAGWPLAGQEDTIVLRVHDDGAANEDPSITVVEAAAAAPATHDETDAATEVAAEPMAALVLQLAAGGYPGEGMPIAVHLIVRDGYVDIGSACEGPWRDDAYLDGWHVRFTSAAGGVRVLDEGSRGGVWLRLDGGRWLLDGDRFRLGTEFLRYDAAESSACANMLREGDRGRVQLVVEDEPVGPALPIADELVLGREAADAVFPHDPYVSAHHCRLIGVDDGVWLEDLGSSNGTWIRLRSGETIPFGSVIAMGSALYRVESGEP